MINPDFNTENTNNDETLMNIRIRKNLNLNEAPKKLKKEKKNCCWINSLINMILIEKRVLWIPSEVLCRIVIILKL